MAKDFYKPDSGLTAEEKAINDAIDKAYDAYVDKRHVDQVTLVLYCIGLPLYIFGAKGSSVERLGLALIITAIICLVFSWVVLRRRSRSTRKTAIALMMPYKKQKATPFYNELSDKFAKEKDIHFHLEDNGSITIRDRRKGKK